MYFAINCDQAWVISFVVTIVTYSCNFFTKFVTGQQGKSGFLHPTLPQTHQVQFRKTFYGRKLQIFVISLRVCPWQPFPA